ncbi:MAG: FtsX-like permease family protein [Acidobacteriota bacterium]
MQRYNAQMVLHVLSDTDAQSRVAGAVRQTIRNTDPYLPLAAPQPLSDAMAWFFLPQRIAAWVAGVMGVFALLLASIGVYGLTSFMVSGRTREFGIRLGLGATANRVVWSVLREGALAPGLGVAVGMAGGVAFAVFARDIVTGLRPTDPLAFGATPVAICLVVVAAIVTPVTRVLRRDPMAALRNE